MIQELLVLKEIRNTDGKGSEKEKKKLIKDNDSKILRSLFNVCYNPFFTTKISKIDWQFVKDYNTESYETANQLYADFERLTNELSKKKALNDEDRKEVHLFLAKADNLFYNQNEDTDLIQYLSGIIIKDLSIGVKAKTINSALKEELIPTPEVMKATDLDVNENIHWLKDVNHFYGELKYDGVRVLAFYQPDKDSFLFFTRNFNQIPNEFLSKIESELKQLIHRSNLIDFENQNVFFDGELTDLNRQNVSGKLNKMLRGKLSEKESDNLVFNVFDFEYSDVYSTKKGNLKYIKRRQLLEEIFNNNHHYRVILSELYQFNNLNEATEKFNEVLKKNEEGIVLKHPDHFYEVKRSKNWLKLKAVLDCDLIIYDYIKGKGKREGYIGSLCLTDSTNTLKVDVGSGFSDDDLEMLNQRLNEGKLIDKIVKISYNQRIKDKHNNESLFLPRFLEFRTDKDESDSIQKLK